MSRRKFHQISRWSAVFILLFSGFVMGIFTSAQDDDFVPATIELTGTINEIAESIIIVSGLPVDISGVSLDHELSVGMIVMLSGIINEQGLIIPAVLSIIGEATPTPEVTETPQPEITPTPINPDNIIIIEGPVQNININVITIYDINITIAPQNPVLNLIQIDRRHHPY